MEKYKLIVLINCHENKDSIKDTIENIKKFNSDVCIVINNGSSEDLSEFVSNDVFIIERLPLNKKVLGNEVLLNYERFDTMVPLHIQLKDCLVANDLKSEYVLLMASNQLFVNRGLYDFMKNYSGSYYNRDIDGGCVSSLKSNPIFTKYYDEIGKENFKHQSNHDGMFFKYNVFMEMMEYFEDFRYLKLNFHAEEFLYAAYLFKNHKDELVEFGKYNYWQPSWRQSASPASVEDIKVCIKDGLFLAKRIDRDINNETRKYIRELK